MEHCIDCGGTIPKDQEPKCGQGWIINKGAGLICPPCCDAEIRMWLEQTEEETWAEYR